MRVKISEQGEVATANLSGEMTEASDFTPLLGLEKRSLVLDLAEVRRINSSGVRGWLQLLKALEERGASLSLVRCSVPFVQQLNMISNFRGRAEVRSVLAPYHCNGCDEDHLQQIEMSEKEGHAVERELPCPDCGAKMEFDDIAESYLAFRTV